MNKSSKAISVISIVACSLLLLSIVGYMIFSIIWESSDVSDINKSLDFYRINNAQYYVYQQKVAVTMDGDNDSLDLRTGKYRENWLNNSSENVLKGNFQKVAWNNDKLYILSDDRYYEFDINSYEVPKNYDGNSSKLTYTLTEYSKSQFEKNYKSSDSFDWYDN